MSLSTKATAEPVFLYIAGCLCPKNVGFCFLLFFFGGGQWIIALKTVVCSFCFSFLLQGQKRFFIEAGSLDLIISFGVIFSNNTCLIYLNPSHARGFSQLPSCFFVYNFH